MVLAAIGIPTSFGAGVVAAGSSESAGGTTEPREIVQTDSAPRFESFTVSGLEQSYVADSQPTRHWCGPLGVGRFHWSISGGTEPLEITIAGQLVNPEDRSVDIPCRQIRQEYLSGPQPSASVVQVIAEVRDSDNQSGSAAIAIGFVSDAPTTQIDEIGVYAGVYDAFFSVRPWPTNHSPMDPLPRLALVRYRETGTTSWNYVIPLPAEPQNSCGPWCGRPHVSDLKQNQDYEHQAAWIWMELPLQWGERPPAGEGWWRSWASPEAMNWTEPRNFRTYGVENVVVEARDHSVTVSWRERGGKVHTWLTSPDWPGAIWTDPLNGHRWPYPTTDQEGEWSTAVFRGLPPDTNFNVTFKRTLPARFVQTAPQEYQVRTRPNASALTPGVFDPRSVTVAVVDDDLEVEWNDQSPSGGPESNCSPETQESVALDWATGTATVCCCPAAA